MKMLLIVMAVFPLMIAGIIKLYKDRADETRAYYTTEKTATKVRRLRKEHKRRIAKKRKENGETVVQESKATADTDYVNVRVEGEDNPDDDLIREAARAQRVLDRNSSNKAKPDKVESLTGLDAEQLQKATEQINKAMEENSELREAAQNFLKQLTPEKMKEIREAAKAYQKLMGGKLEE